MLRAHTALGEQHTVARRVAQAVGQVGLAPRDQSPDRVRTRRGGALLDRLAQLVEDAQHDSCGYPRRTGRLDCIGLGEIDRAHTSALTARTAIDAAVTAVQAALAQTASQPAGDRES